MLYRVLSEHDPFAMLIKDDPVRPEIPLEDRLGHNKDVFVLLNANKNQEAVVCASYQDEVPTATDELRASRGEPKVAVFYTIWSYARGAGTKLIFEAQDYIKREIPSITRFVTLSPKSDLARKFYTRNGAAVYRENNQTINYEYAGGSDVSVPFFVGSLDESTVHRLNL